VIPVAFQGSDLLVSVQSCSKVRKECELLSRVDRWESLKKLGQPDGHPIVVLALDRFCSHEGDTQSNEKDTFDFHNE
jgi:hypothetical protein